MNIGFVKDQSKNRTLAEVKRIMDKEVLPFIGDLQIAAIRKRDILAVIDQIAERAPGRANKVLAHLKRLFGWAASRDLIDTSPAQFVDMPSPTRSRDRILTDAELQAIWRATDGNQDFDHIVRLLALTGQRRDEVGRMRWSEISDDLTLWSLPGERTKNGLPHIVPLPTQAQAVLAARLRHKDHVFGLTSGFKGWSNCRARLENRVNNETLFPEWRLHDLRRTCATGMGDLGVSPHVVEAVLNHISGTKRGVAGIYNKAQYRAEKAAALQAWSDHLERITTTAAT